MQSSSILSDLAAGRNRVAIGAAARPVHVALLAAIATAGLSTTVLGQQSYSAIGGVVDEFAMPTEPASPDAELLTFLQGTGNPVVGFDQAGAFGHTFDNLPQNVVGATVTARLKAVGGNPGNDLLYFERLDDPGIWCTTIANLPEAGGAWTGGQTAAFTLDLSDLADYLGRTSVIDRINADGSLDVYIQDDTAVDYLALSLTTEDRYDGGEADGCDGVTDPASPDAELLAFLQSTGPVADFDQAGFFGHTFGNLPENVVSATLEVHLAVARSGSANDLLYLERLDDPDGVWCTTIANLPEAGGTWDGTQSATITLDLANLPDYNGRTSVIDRINADGSLDVYIQDDTCVDSMTLTVRTAETVITSGFDIQPTGDAVVTSDGSGGVAISNFGPTGGDGFDITACNGCVPNGGFRPSGFVSGYVGCLYSAISDGENWYSIAWQTNGVWYSDLNPHLSRIEFLGDSAFQTVDITAVFTAAFVNAVRYDVVESGQIVHTESHPISNEIAPAVGIDPCALVDDVAWSGRRATFESGWRVRFGGSETLEMPSGAEIPGSELRITGVPGGAESWLPDGIMHDWRFTAVEHSPVQIDDLAMKAGDMVVSAESNGRITFDAEGMHVGTLSCCADLEMELDTDFLVVNVRTDFVPFTLDQDGQSIQTAAVGTVDGVPNSALGHATLVNSAGSLQAIADFSALGSTDVRVDVYNAGVFVGSEVVTNGNGAVAAMLGGGTLVDSIVDKGCETYHLLQAVAITPNLGPFAGAAQLVGDEIRLIAVDPTVSIDAIEVINLAVDNIDEIVITDIVVPNPCPTDFDGDGSTGFTDLTSILSSWGPCAAPCPYDLDENGMVGFSDLTTLLSSWGACS